VVGYGETVNKARSLREEWEQDEEGRGAGRSFEEYMRWRFGLDEPAAGRGSLKEIAPTLHREQYGNQNVHR
jgi:hypothetical protein